MPFLFQLQFTEFSILWIIPSLLSGLGYAYFLYRKKAELSAVFKKILFLLRTFTVALITFLLFAPSIKIIKKTVEKPLLLILQDNSASIKLAQSANFNINRYNQELQKLINSFGEDYEVNTVSFGSTITPNISYTYQDKITDISAALKYINARFTNRNIGAVIIATDGIYTSGGNPQYEAQNLKAPIYTIAMGDTIPKKDLLIANVNYNNIVYLGNNFQIEVTVVAYQSKGISSRLSITDHSGHTVNKAISIPTDEYRVTIPIVLSAKKKGIQKFTVTVSPIGGELSKQNNKQTFFVEVLDGRQKVFILANAPHPDITALKQSIESNKNYEVQSGFAANFSKDAVNKADLLILHQLPTASLSGESLTSLLAKKNVWYILGEQSNVVAFSGLQNTLGITSAGSIQEATTTINPEFYDFVISDATRLKLQNFAPLLTPFGNYGLKSQASVLLYQKIGKLSTNRPLLVFSNQGNQRTGVLTGEGIWRWRLEDFKENNNHQAIDELISKTVQYLSSKGDKRKFRVYPARNTFDESENVVLNAELYNDAFELINTPDVSITLKNNQNKSFPFLFSKTGAAYQLDAGVLPSGEYLFTASTQLGKVRHTASGQFVISQQQREFRQTTANHQLLFSMAHESGGELIYPAKLSSLKDKIKRNELVKTISYEDKRFEELINVKWIFLLILILLSAEWFSRKRNGEL